MQALADNDVTADLKSAAEAILRVVQAYEAMEKDYANNQQCDPGNLQSLGTVSGADLCDVAYRSHTNELGHTQGQLLLTIHFEPELCAKGTLQGMQEGHRSRI